MGERAWNARNRVAAFFEEEEGIWELLLGRGDRAPAWGEMAPPREKISASAASL